MGTRASKMILLKIAAGCLGGAALLVLPVRAFAVNCFVQGAVPSLAFGVYDASSPVPTDAAPTFTVRCNQNPTPDTITISLDQGGSYLAPDRRMSLASFLNYNAFKDASYTNIWGDGITLGTPVVSIKDVNPWTSLLTLYGRIPAGQTMPPGIYNDTLNLTLTFTGANSPRTYSVAVSAQIVGSCSFSTSGSISYGSLDPVLAPPVVGTVVQPAIQCSDTLPYTITDDDGLWETGVDANRMQDSVLGTSYIPYSISYTSAKTGNGSPQPMDISANIAGGAYVGSPIASYNDVITLTVTF